MVIATSASIEVVSRESFARRLEGMRSEKSSSSSSSSLLSTPPASSSSTVACVNCHKQRGDSRNGPRNATGSGNGGSATSYGKRKSAGRHKTKSSHVCTATNNNTNSGYGRSRKKSQNQHQSLNATATTSATKSTGAPGSITSGSPIVVNIRDSLLRSRKYQGYDKKFRQSSLDADSDASSSRSTDEDIWNGIEHTPNHHASFAPKTATRFTATASPAGHFKRHDHNRGNHRREDDEQYLDDASSTSLSEELSSSPEIVSYLHNHYNHHHQHSRNRLRSSRSDRYKKYTRGNHSNNSNRINSNNDHGFSSKSHHYYGGLYPNFYHQGKVGDSNLSLCPSVPSTPSSRKHWTAIISEIEKSHSEDADINLAAFTSATAKHYYSNLLNNYNINHDNCHCDSNKPDDSLNNRSCTGSSNGCKDVEVKKRNVADCENVDLICNDLYTSNEKLSEESTDESDSSDKASVLSSSDAYSDDSATGGVGPPIISYNRNAKKFGRKFSSEQLEDLAEYTAGAPILQYDCHPTQCTTCMHAISSYPYNYSYHDAYESNQASQFLFDLHAHHQMYYHHHHSHHHNHQFTAHHNHHLQRFYQNRHRQYFYNHHRQPYLYSSQQQHPHYFPNQHHLRQYRYLYPMQFHNHWIIERPSGTRDKLSPACSTSDVGDGVHDGDGLVDGKNDDNDAAFVSSSCSSALSSSSSSLMLPSPPTSPPLPPSPTAMITTSSNTVVTICSKSSGKFFSQSTAPFNTSAPPALSSATSSSSSSLSNRSSLSSSYSEEENPDDAVDKVSELALPNNTESLNATDAITEANQTTQSSNPGNVNQSKDDQDTAMVSKTSNIKEDRLSHISTTTPSTGDNITTTTTINNNNNDHQHASSPSTSSPSEEDLHKNCNLNNSVFMDLTGLDVSFTVHYPGDPAHLSLTSGSNHNSSKPISNATNHFSGSHMPFFSPSVSYNPHLSHHNHRKNSKGVLSSLPMPLMSPSHSSTRSCRSGKKEVYYNKMYSNRNKVPLALTSLSSSLSSSADDDESDPQAYELAISASRPWATSAVPEADVPAAVFSVMCYNVLSDKLCTKQMYGYCPSWALSWEYRKKGILGEIFGCNADIITLQEVETEQYYGLFLPDLLKRGYDGVFLPKSRVRTMNSEKEKMSVDGCAIFYRKSKFEKVSEHHVEFSQLATKDGASNTDTDMINRVSTKDNIAIVAMLRTKPAAYDQSPVPAPKGLSQMLMVSTAHIHWDPQHPDVKLVQTIMLVEQLRKFIKEASVQFRPNAPPPSVDSGDMCASLPLILCGDFNSLPDSGVFEYLSKGKLDTRHRDFDGQSYKAFMKDRNENGILNHNFKLSSAYKDIIPYTNYTFDFKGVIDYIFYSGQHFKLLGTMPLHGEDWFRINKIVGCPHPYVPSDHFPLMAEFSLPVRPPPKPSSGAAPR